MVRPTNLLRCVVFHNISAIDSPFTKGMRVDITPAEFEVALNFFTRYYTPVSLRDVLADSAGGSRRVRSCSRLTTAMHRSWSGRHRFAASSVSLQCFF